jgi:hypothetical protein
MVQVVVGIGQVRDMFDRLIGLSESREDVAHFASSLMHKLDAGELTFMDSADAGRIRRALNFLSQADLLVDEHHFLFSVQDFITERAELRLD